MRIFLWGLLAMAAVATVLSGSCHVMSLIGIIVTAPSAQIIAWACFLLPWFVGFYMHAHFGNAQLRGTGGWMEFDQLTRGLTILEGVLVVVLLGYCVGALLVFWPHDKRSISGLHLSAADARAAWVFDLAFGVCGLAIVRSAMRVARGVAPASPPMSNAMFGGLLVGGTAVGALVAGWSTQ